MDNWPEPGLLFVEDLSVLYFLATLASLFMNLPQSLGIEYLDTRPKCNRAVMPLEKFHFDSLLVVPEIIIS